MRARVIRASEHLRELTHDVIKSAIIDGVDRGVLHSAFCDCESCIGLKHKIADSIEAKIREGLNTIE